jgi:putative transposase
MPVRSRSPALGIFAVHKAFLPLRPTPVRASCRPAFAKGLTTGEISAHFAEVYGASIGKDTASRITDKVLEEMATWSARPLQPVYAAIFIDTIFVKVRDGQVGNQPFYAAIGVDLVGAGTCSGCGPGRVAVSRRSSG